MHLARIRNHPVESNDHFSKVPMHPIGPETYAMTAFDVDVRKEKILHDCQKIQQKVVEVKQFYCLEV